MANKRLSLLQGGRGRLYQALVQEMAKQQGSGNPPKAAVSVCGVEAKKKIDLLRHTNIDISIV